MKQGVLKKGLLLGICLGLVFAIGGCGSPDPEEDLTQQEQGTEGGDTTDPAAEGEDGTEENTENPT